MESNIFFWRDSSGNNGFSHVPLVTGDYKVKTQPEDPTAMYSLAHPAKRTLFKSLCLRLED